MLNPNSMFREISGDLLLAYLRHRNIAWLGQDLPSMTAPERVTAGRSFLSQLAPKDHAVIFDDAQRILALADEIGVQAMRLLPGLTEALSELENGAMRALWLLIHHPSALELAEQRRFLDGKRNSRIWSGYATTRSLTVLDTDSAIEALRAALVSHFDNAQVVVEGGWRSRPQMEGDAKLYQANIFVEGWRNSRKAFVKNQLDRIAERPVHEAAVT